jgi:hypothetical protein
MALAPCSWVTGTAQRLYREEEEKEKGDDSLTGLSRLN